jgi:PKD repeat protein
LSVTGTASPTSGDAPLEVAFACTPSGGTAPYTYAWSFGDAGTSTSQNPSHTYSIAGTFVATVTVTDAASHTATWTSSEITVTGVVSLACSATPTSGDVPLEVAFTCTPSGGTEPYTYAWQFGDGSTSTSQNPSHTYGVSGTYTVNVTVTDSAMHSTRWTTTITVIQVEPIPEMSPVLVIPVMVLVFFVLMTWNRRRGR